jgi:hypothetical protein
MVTHPEEYQTMQLQKLRVKSSVKTMHEMVKLFYDPETRLHGVFVVSHIGASAHLCLSRWLDGGTVSSMTKGLGLDTHTTISSAWDRNRVIVGQYNLVNFDNNVVEIVTWLAAAENAMFVAEDVILYNNYIEDGHEVSYDFDHDIPHRRAWFIQCAQGDELGFQLAETTRTREVTRAVRIDKHVQVAYIQDDAHVHLLSIFGLDTVTSAEQNYAGVSFTIKKIPFAVDIELLLARPNALEVLFKKPHDASTYVASLNELGRTTALPTCVDALDNIVALYYTMSNGYSGVSISKYTRRDADGGGGGAGGAGGGGASGAHLGGTRQRSASRRRTASRRRSASRRRTTLTKPAARSIQTFATVKSMRAEFIGLQGFYFCLNLRPGMRPSNSRPF